MSEKEWSKEWSRSDYNCEPDRSGSESEGAIKTCPNGFSSEGKPSDEKIVTLALANVAALERRCAALEKESRETAKSPEADHSVAQKISELRESFEDSCCPQGDKSSSSSKEEEHFLVAPIRGIDEDGCLILGDRKILSASALKI